MTTQAPPRPPTTPTTVADPPPPRRSAGAVGAGVVLVAAGTVWLLAVVGVEVPVRVAAPGLLVLLGIAVVVAGVRGEDHAAIGLAVFLGVWLTIAVVVAGVLDTPLAGAIGDRHLAPTTTAELEDQRLFAGTQVIDLRGLELPAGTSELQVSTVLGEVEVVVPGSMAVRVDARVAGGTLNLFGDVVDGLGLAQEAAIGGGTDRVLELEVRVGLGEVRVRSD